MKTENQRRNFFKKAGAAAIGAGLMTALPEKLVAAAAAPKKSEQTISIAINPMAVKREKRK
ncbi:MAG: hypothetical protein HUU02_04740 [Bacteroidetes bacterium]|nr:hypothetical protein [Bacteroidota bacterium]